MIDESEKAKALFGVEAIRAVVRDELKAQAPTVGEHVAGYTTAEAWARLTAARAKQHREDAEAERGHNREAWAQHTVRADECDDIAKLMPAATTAVEGRDVLEAAHQLRLLGCEGENALEVMVDAARRIRSCPLVSFCWGLRDGQWWLVVYHDGEPHAGYHQQHGRINAARQFSRWTHGAEGPAPEDLTPKAPHGIDAIRAVVRDELRMHAAAASEAIYQGLRKVAALE